MYNRNTKPSRGGHAQFRRGRSFGQHSAAGFSRRSTGFRRAVPRKAKLDITSFINKTITPQVEEVYKPEHLFSEFGFQPVLAQAIRARGYSEPTPIQDKVISYVLEKKDIVGLANTGTGKTAAFLLPLINGLLAKRDQQILVLAPTRELAIQIDQEFRSFARRLSLYSVVCVGGENIGGQIRQLRRRNDFVIGTPGRVIDLIKRDAFRLDNVHTVVLDEADRMFDMGFIDDVKFIMSKVPEKRHTLLFSATMSSNIEALIRDFLKDPVTVSVKTQETAKNVEQDVVRVQGSDKVEMLYKFLVDSDFKKVLVFGRTKHGVEKLSKILERKGIKVDSIHSNKSHGQRQRALRNFKENRVQALVATDIAARGLDISGITHVINYELPATYEDYIHRIGRTGRGVHQGKALTFVD